MIYELIWAAVAFIVLIAAGLYKRKLFPTAIQFFISYRVFEMLSASINRSVLSLYILHDLMLPEYQAKMLFHGIYVIKKTAVLAGAIITDNWFGKYHTIFICMFMGFTEKILLFTTSLDYVKILQKPLFYIFILVASFSRFSVEVNAPFGGDQYKLPEEQDQLHSFLSLEFCFRHAAYCVGTLVGPILRAKVRCSDKVECFPFAFGLPIIVYPFAMALFLLGRRWYIKKKPEGNPLWGVICCISHAIALKFKKGVQQRDHWLDRADDKYDSNQIADIKRMFKLLVIFVPITVCSALYDQMETSWTFQATHMDGKIFNWFTLLPDQMPLLRLIMFFSLNPIMDVVVYPFFKRLRLLRTPLQRITCSCVLAAVSFIIAGFISLEIEKRTPVLPLPGEAHLRIYNSLPCVVNITNGSTGIPDTTLDSMALYEHKHLNVSGNKTLVYTWTLVQCRDVDPPTKSGVFSFEIQEETMLGQLIKFGESNEVIVQKFEDDVSRSWTTSPLIRALVNDANVVYTVEYTERFKVKSSNQNLTEVPADTYSVSVTGKKMGEIVLHQGGVYTLLIDYTDKSNSSFKLWTVSDPNSLHMLWLLPQYFVMALSQVMCAVQLLRFAFAESPLSMKPVVMVLWVGTEGMGNAVVVVIEACQFFESRGLIMFMYAGIMGIDSLVFSLVAVWYKQVNRDEPPLGTYWKPRRLLHSGS